MTAADMLLSLANALRRFNDTLPDNPGTISFYSYKEDSDCGREVIDIPLKERDILETQINIELTPEQFGSISSIVMAELDRFNNWYERHKGAIRGGVREAIIMRELKEARERIDNDFASKLEESRIREKLFEDLNRACYGIDRNVRCLDDIRSRSTREYIKPYYERMIKFTSYPDYDLQEVQEDCNRSAHQRESVIKQRDERYRFAEDEARKRISQAAYNIYYDVAANMEPIADFLMEKTEVSNKGITPKKTPPRQKGRPGTPKEIDSIEKCFISVDDCAIFIDTIKQYKKQGNSFTGPNCCNAYHFLDQHSKLNENLKSKSKFAELLHKQYPSLYPRCDSSGINSKIRIGEDDFVKMLKQRFTIE